MTFLRGFGILALGGLAVIVGGILFAFDSTKPQVVVFDASMGAADDGLQIPAGASHFGDVPTIVIVAGLVLIAAWVLIFRPRTGLTGRLTVGVLAIIGLVTVVLGIAAGYRLSFPTTIDKGPVDNVDAVETVNAGPLQFLVGDSHAELSLAIIALGVIILGISLGLVISRLGKVPASVASE